MNLSKVNIVGFFLLFMLGSSLCAQENLELYRGNSKYADGEFDEAKVHYQKAIENNPSSYKGTYNLGNANYKQENFEEALSIYEQALSASKNDVQKSDAFHNLGNTYLQSGKYEESIKAYKNALRLNPTSEDSRYNLAFAQKMMKKKEKQEQENNNEKQEDIEPSEYAKMLKERCDRLAEVFQFREAYSLMQEGLKKDKTVAHYQDYIKRLGDVVGITE